MCTVCETVVKADTPQGAVEIIAVARPLGGGLGFHTGYLTLAIPGQDIRAEFSEILSRKTWEKAWDYLIRQIEGPRFQNNKLFKEPAMIDLLETANKQIALLPV